MMWFVRRSLLSALLLACSGGLVPSAHAGGIIGNPVTRVSASYTSSNPASGQNLTSFQILPGTGATSYFAGQSLVASGLSESTETIDFPSQGVPATISPDLTFTDGTGASDVFSIGNGLVKNNTTITATATLVSNGTAHNLSAFQHSSGVLTLTFTPPKGGTFNIAMITQGPPDPWDVTYDPGFTVDLELIAVPEPASLLSGLSCMAAVGMLGWLRRRRQKAAAG